MNSHTNDPWYERHDRFAAVLKEYPVKTGIEIGVAYGGNADTILSRTDVDVLYGIDPYTYRWSYNDGMNRSQSDFDRLYQNTLARLAPHGARYRHIRKPSIHAVHDIPIVDFIYIDGDHSYAGCLTDIRLYFPKIKEGGIIAGDDYNSERFPGVERAVKRFFGTLGYTIHEEGPRVWWVLKGPIPENLSWLDRMFLFNRTLLWTQFYAGEFYHSTIGKLLYWGDIARKRLMRLLALIIKKTFPRQIVSRLRAAHLAREERKRKDRSAN